MTGFWSRAEQERQALQAEFARNATSQMLTAGALDPESLTPQARRTLAWLAESDDPTVTGVADLLTAAHHSGGRTALAQPREDQASARPDDLAVPPTREANGSDAPSHNSAGPVADHLDGPSGRPIQRAAHRPDIQSRHPVDRVVDRLEALGRRADDRAVEL